MAMQLPQIENNSNQSSRQAKENQSEHYFSIPKSTVKDRTISELEKNLFDQFIQSDGFKQDQSAQKPQQSLNENKLLEPPKINQRSNSNQKALNTSITSVNSNISTKSDRKPDLIIPKPEPTQSKRNNEAQEDQSPEHAETFMITNIAPPQVERISNQKPQSTHLVSQSEQKKKYSSDEDSDDDDKKHINKPFDLKELDDPQGSEQLDQYKLEEDKDLFEVSTRLKKTQIELDNITADMYDFQCTIKEMENDFQSFGLDPELLDQLNRDFAALWTSEEQDNLKKARTKQKQVSFSNVKK